MIQNNKIRKHELKVYNLYTVGGLGGVVGWGGVYVIKIKEYWVVI